MPKKPSLKAQINFVISGFSERLHRVLDVIDEALNSDNAPYKKWAVEQLFKYVWPAAEKPSGAHHKKNAALSSKSTSIPESLKNMPLFTQKQLAAMSDEELLQAIDAVLQDDSGLDGWADAAMPSSERPSDA